MPYRFGPPRWNLVTVNQKISLLLSVVRYKSTSWALRTHAMVLQVPCSPRGTGKTTLVEKPGMTKASTATANALESFGFNAASSG